MSSFMRSVERRKIRTQMENQGVRKISKKLKPWWDAFKEEKHNYLEQKKEISKSAELKQRYDEQEENQ